MSKVYKWGPLEATYHDGSTAEHWGFYDDDYPWLFAEKGKINLVVTDLSPYDDEDGHPDSKQFRIDFEQLVEWMLEVDRVVGDPENSMETRESAKNTLLRCIAIIDNE